MKFYIHYEGGDGGGQRGQPFCKSINTALLPDDATLADALLLFLHAAVARFGPDHPLGEPLKKLRDSGGDKAKTLLGIVDVCDADACFLDPSVHVSTFEEGQDLTVSINRRTKVDVVDSRKKKEEELAGLVHDIATSLGMHCGGEWADIRGAEEEDKGQSPRPQAQREEPPWVRSERSQVHHEGKLEGMLEASGAPHGPSDVTRLVSRRASGEVEGANGPRAGHAGRGNEEEKARAPSDIDRLMRISDARSVLESLGVPGDTVKEEDIGGMLVELGARKLEGGELRAALAAFSVAVRAGFADATSMEGLARVWIAAGRGERALECAEEGLNLSPRSIPLLQAKAEALRLVGRYSDSAACCDEAVEGLRLLSAKRQRVVGIIGEVREEDLRIGCVRAMSASGAMDDVTARVVMSVVNKNAEHTDGLIEYARLALKRGQVDQAVEVALRVLVHRPSGTDAHKLVSDCLASAEGLEACERKLSGREGADAAFAFVANAVKQAGGVDAASRLAWASLKENPGCPGHALALMHVLELQFRYREALQAAHVLLSNHPERTVLGEPLSPIADVVQRLVEASAEPGPPASAQALAAACRRVAFAQREIDGGLLSGLEGEVGEREEGAEQGADSEREPPAGEGGAGVPVSMKRAAEEGGGAGSGSAGHEGWGHLDGNDDRYRGDPSRTELEVLAVVFTLVKVAFLSGRVSEAASVMPAAERMRRRAGARRPLHMTAFRNEAAYYTCILQLLTSHRFPADDLDEIASAIEATPHRDAGAAESPSPVAFVIGDSHVLPMAFRVMRNGGRLRVLVPLLVTGLKIWHLRPEGTFYPKHNFWQAIRMVAPQFSCPNLSLDPIRKREARAKPERYDAGRAAHAPASGEGCGAAVTNDVVLALGEIDCREGMLRAVDSLKYDSFPAALEATVALYHRIVQSLPSMFRLRIAVLPAPPVLEPTRAIVLCFNHALAMNLGRFLHSGPPLRYLDIQDDLLEGPGVERLRDKGKMEALARGIGEGHLQGSEDSVDLREIRLKGHYRLDGTHLSPAVVELVAGAVGEA